MGSVWQRLFDYVWAGCYGRSRGRNRYQSDETEDCAVWHLLLRTK